MENTGTYSPCRATSKQLFRGSNKLGSSLNFCGQVVKADSQLNGKELFFFFFTQYGATQNVFCYSIDTGGIGNSFYTLSDSKTKLRLNSLSFAFVQLSLGDTAFTALCTPRFTNSG